MSFFFSLGTLWEI